MEAGELGFVGVLYELPSNYSHIMNVAVDVPGSVSEAFGMRGHVPVVGTADGAEFAATLVPVGGGRHRLFLNNAVRGAIDKGAGDSVEIRICVDRRDRTPETPPALKEALAEDGATAAWEALTPSRRKECLVWLADAKREQTRAARIGRIVRVAIEEALPVSSDRTSRRSLWQDGDHGVTGRG
ncbi:MAG: YdeI/OmpD-associated family protein [Acidimicrobiaceae bacterium]|nr:YdeI/OmpD-associated family protein [Acidimicrobiaceae bacterium]